MLLTPPEVGRLLQVLSGSHASFDKAAQQFAAAFPGEQRIKACSAIGILLEVRRWWW